MATGRHTTGRVVRLSLKYVPIAYAALRPGGSWVLSRAGHRTQDEDPQVVALEHAAHLIDGSVLPVFDGDTRVWIVFSGNLPVASHPVVRTPLPQLLEHYDLSKRHRPTDPAGGSTPSGRPQHLPAQPKAPGSQWRRRSPIPSPGSTPRSGQATRQTRH